MRMLAPLLPLVAFFHLGQGADAQDRSNEMCNPQQGSDDEVCLLQYRLEDKSLNPNPVKDQENQTEEVDHDLGHVDWPSGRCQASGAKMWMFRSGVRRIVEAVVERSMKGIPDSGGEHWQGQCKRMNNWLFSNIKMKVSLGPLEVQIQTGHGIWVAARQISIDFEADYWVKQAWILPSISEGKVSSTTASNASVGIMFHPFVETKGRLDVAMETLWKMVFKPLKLTGAPLSDYVIHQMRVSIEHNVNTFLGVHFDQYMQRQLRPALRSKDMAIPMSLGSPLDGFFLEVPLCYLSIDEDRLVFIAKGVVTHPESDKIYDVPLADSLLDEPLHSNMDVVTDVTAWTLNSFLWLAYEMGRFHLAPNTMLGDREDNVRRLNAIMTTTANDQQEHPMERWGETDRAGVLAGATEIQAFKAPNASFVDGKVLLSVPLDVKHFWYFGLALSVRCTVVLSTAVQNRADGHSSQLTFQVDAVDDIQIKFRHSEVNIGLLNVFVREWVNYAFLPMINLYLYHAGQRYIDVTDFVDGVHFETASMNLPSKHLLWNSNFSVAS